MEFIAFVVVIGIIAIIVSTLSSGFKEGLGKPSPQRTGNRSPRQRVDSHWPALGEFDFPVVGESNYQGALRVLAGDHGDQSPEGEYVASLEPEDDNRYDNKAVKVSIDGRTVGYLSRDDARRFRRRLGQKGLTGETTTCAAMISGGFIMKDGSRASYGIQLDLKPFSE